MSSSTTSTQRHHRRLLIGGIVVPIALVGPMVCATSASAAPISSKAQLVTAVQSANSGSTVVLGSDLLGDGGASDVITLPSAKSVTLDLNGYDLDLDRIAIPASSFLTLSDGTGTGAALSVGGASVASSDSGGTGIELARTSRLEIGSHVELTTIGSESRAGIGTLNSVDTNAVLYIDDGATVVATGGSLAAGIGGGEGAVPLSTVSIGAATVTATAGDGAAAIGGGYASTGASPAIAIENGDVTLAGAVASTFSSFDNTATGGGTSTVRVASGSTLTVPTGLTLHNSGDLEVAGTLTGSGSIDNTGGTIRRGAGGTIDDAALTVTGRNHAVSFASGSGTVTAPAVQHVYATSFAKAGLDLTAYTGSSGGKPLAGWSATGTPHVDNADLLAPLSSGGGESDPVTLIAAYESPITFSGSALPNAATGRTYSARVPVTGDATAYSVASNPASGLPADTVPSFPSGLAIDPSTGTISGQAATSGHYSFVVTASSPHQRQSQAVTLDVAGAPVMATIALRDASVGTTYSAPVLATSERGSVAFAITAGALPTGLHLDASTGTIAGTPMTVEMTAFTVSATNAYGTTDRALTISVAAAPSGSGSGSAGGGSSAGGSGTNGGAGSGSGTDGSSGSSPGAPSSPTPSTSSSTGALVSAPVLPILGTTTVKLGHALALSVAASSTVPVTYSVPTKQLPPGISLDRSAGLLFGSPRNSGRFVLHLTATSSAGTATRTYTIVVPAITRLVTGSASAVTPRSGSSVRITIRGLKAGEHWRIALNGRQVQAGVAAFGGSVKRTVKLPKRTKDAVHRISVSGDRRITDPSTTATHELTVTAVVAKKALRITRSGSTLTVRGLAAKERVTITRGRLVVATGRADGHGVFVVTIKRLKPGTHTATGSAKHRTGHLRVRR